MATPIIQSLGLHNTAGAAVATVTITVTATTTVGHSVLVAAKGGGSAVVTGVTDSRLNTYTVDKTVSGGSTANVARCTIATGKRLVIGDTITVTFGSAATASIYYWAEAWEAHTLTVGTSTSVTATTGTSLTTPTLTPTTAGEFFFAVGATNAKPTTGPAVTSPFVTLVNTTVGTATHRLVLVATYLEPGTTVRAVEYHWTGTISNMALALVSYKVTFGPLTGQASLTGSGVISGTGVRTAFASAAITGSGVLLGVPTLGRSTTGTATGSGVISATGAVYETASATLSGSGLIQATAHLTVLASAGLTGSGVISATGTRIAFASATVTGSGVLSAIGTVFAVASATLHGVGVLAASPILAISTSGTATGLGVISATATAYAPFVTTATIALNKAMLTARADVVKSSPIAQVRLKGNTGDAAHFARPLVRRPWQR